MSIEAGVADCLKLNVTECLNKKGSLTHNRCYRIFILERSSDYEPTIEKRIPRSLGENAVAGQSRLSGTAYRVFEIAAFIPRHRAGHYAAFSQTITQIRKRA